MKAIIYCRVSSDDQVKGYSLKSQEDACRQKCEQERWKVEGVFIEEGESAKTENRTQLLKLLEFCSKHRNKIDFLVVHKIDRFSRSVDAHHWIKANLKRFGVRLVSVTEPIDDTSTGKLSENVLAAFAQFDNDIRAERTTLGMRERLKSGEWCWLAPIGYKNTIIGERKTIVPDEKAPLVKRIYEEFSTGLFTIRQIAAKANRWGLRSKRGFKITPQIASKILSNKVYMGVAESVVWEITVDGKWEAIVIPELWQKVQMVRSGTFNANNAPRARRNPVFPLRRFVKCGNCGNPLTGSKSTGRNQKYDYYRCHKCGSRSIPKNELENAFLELLRFFQPAKEQVELFRATVIDVWKTKHHEKISQNKKIKTEIQELENIKSSLIRKGATGELSNEDAFPEIERIKNEILTKNVALKDFEIDGVELEGIINLAENFIANIAPFWRDAELDQKQRFQQLVFPEGVAYKNGKFETARIALSFAVIRDSNGVRERLVGQTLVQPKLPKANISCRGIT